MNLIKFTLLLLSALSVNIVSAGTLYITHDPNLNHSELKLVEKFTSTLTQTLTDQKVQPLSLNAAADHQNRDDLILSLGEEAPEGLVMGKGTAPILSIFISKQSFDELTRSAPTSNRNISAIYSDPDPLKQISLIKALCFLGLLPYS